MFWHCDTVTIGGTEKGLGEYCAFDDIGMSFGTKSEYVIRQKFSYVHLTILVELQATFTVFKTALITCSLPLACSKEKSVMSL